MGKTKKNIPLYSIDTFRSHETQGYPYQVEIFDANRHFGVEFPHRHDFYEILFIHKGSGIYIIDDIEYEITPPCIFFLSSGQVHELTISKDIEGYIFLFTADFYNLHHQNKGKLLEFPFFLSTERRNPPLKLKNISDIEFIKQLYQRAIDTSNADTIFKTEIIESLLHALLVTSKSLYPINDPEAQTNKSNILVKNFLALLESNYHKHLRIQDYASALNISPNHLTYVMKQVTGKTTNELIQEKQIIEIKRLLLYSDLNINEIAEKMHFIDQSYFTKFFKSHCGISPLQYRKLQKN